MNYRLYKEEKFHIKTCQNGRIKELACVPGNEAGREQEFIWKLSLLEMTLEEWELTRMPDYNQILMVLEGDAVLAYEGQRVARLKELEQDRFDGAFYTKIFGRTDCYNLTVKKGNIGYLDVWKLEQERQEPEQESPEGYEQVCQTFYCREGYGVVTFADKTCMVKAGQQLIVSYPVSETLSFGIMGEGVLIRAQIFYHTTGQKSEGQHTELEKTSSVPAKPEHKKSFEETVSKEQEVSDIRIGETKGTLEDFKECIKLSLTNFRGSRFIFPYLKTVWYDESLKAGIRKVERFYLPMVLWFAGIAVLGLWGSTVWQPLNVLYILLLWTGLVLFILSPLMYFFAVPKPVKAHIKRISEMTEYEKTVEQKEKEANPMADRILKKYKITGRNVYVEDERPKKREKKPRA